MSNGAPASSYQSCILQRHYTENSKQIFPEMKLRGPSPNSNFKFLWAIYILPQSVCLFCCRKIGGPIVGIYESLKEIWIWKWGLRSRGYFFVGMHESDFLCSVAWICTFLKILPSDEACWGKIQGYMFLPVLKHDQWFPGKQVEVITKTCFQQYCRMSIILTVLSGEASGGGNYNVKTISAVL